SVAVVAAVLVLLGWAFRLKCALRTDAKLVILDEILRSRNDNDPRLDADFNDLSAETKRRFREKYGALAPEKRNERGTVVYLLGRNINDDRDWDFLREVAGEPPCLSLSDCSKRTPGSAEL